MATGWPGLQGRRSPPPGGSGARPTDAGHAINIKTLRGLIVTDRGRDRDRDRDRGESAMEDQNQNMEPESQ
jgi:hypothetical protein